MLTTRRHRTVRPWGAPRDHAVSLKECPASHRRYGDAMIGKIDEVVVDCSDPATLSAFWAEVLGGKPHARDANWYRLDPPGWTRLAFQRVPEPKSVKNRLHLDVAVTDIAAATTEALRLGAQRIGDIHHDSAGTFQVLTDPEGNEWCLVTPP